jgi:hypothetical protein
VVSDARLDYTVDEIPPSILIECGITVGEAVAGRLDQAEKERDRKYQPNAVSPVLISGLTLARSQFR